MLPNIPLHLANVKQAYARCLSLDINPFEVPVVIDVGSTTSYSSSKINGSPCLTRSRCQNFGYWISTKGNYISLDEMLNLQGLDAHDVGYKPAGIPEPVMAAMLGNAMSMNVLQRLIPRVLFHAKLITQHQYSHLASQCD